MSSERSRLEIKTASLVKTCSTSFNPLCKSVLPELTKSAMVSAKPILGAISTEPEICTISASTLLAWK